MSRRSYLKEQIRNLKSRIDNASDDIPNGVIEQWKDELSNFEYELDNLNDDD